MYHSEIMEFVIGASEAADGCDVPVFAAIAIGTYMVSFAKNESERLGKPWYHAEFLAIKMAYEKRDGIGYLDDASIYVNLEPCHFCAAALERVRIKNIFFGAYDSKCGAITNNARLFDHSQIRPNVVGGIQEERCSRVISGFFERLRHSNSVLKDE
ncbi:MAG: hypothetical protein LBJ69_01315 [Holosporales bacterium]|jgi:tRNA(Arg) A34 adenosine deaminase TadA|nr:hypothetical protein [Holosporales bacterium]